MTPTGHIERFTAPEDTTCERCGGEILLGGFIGRVVGLPPGVASAPGLILCDECADDAEDRIFRASGQRAFRDGDEVQ